jgi:hypothetical protein
MGLLKWLSYPFRRQPRRPLATRRPDRRDMGQSRKVPLGMEATDMSVVDAASRRNDALERAHQVRHNDGDNYTAQSSLHVEPMPEDETYARHFYRAFQKRGKPDE